jgi:hypothetical protein
LRFLPDELADLVPVAVPGGLAHVTLLGQAAGPVVPESLTAQTAPPPLLPYQHSFIRQISNILRGTLQGKSHLYIPLLGIAQPQSQFPHSCVCERFIYSQDWSTYFPAAEYAD